MPGVEVSSRNAGATTPSGGLAQRQHRQLVLLEQLDQRLDEARLELGAGAAAQLGDRVLATGMPSWYGRSEVIASNESATKMMRASSGISAPPSPSG